MNTLNFCASRASALPNTDILDSISFLDPSRVWRLDFKVMRCCSRLRLHDDST